MARMKSPYDQPMENAGRIVGPGEVIDIPDLALPSYLEAGWTSGDKATAALVDKLRKEQQAAEQQQEQGGQPASGEEQG